MYSLTPIIESGKVIVQFILAALLITKWVSAEKRFYTDIPFLFGMLFTFIAIGETFDVFFDAHLLPMTLELYKLRVFMVIVGLTFIVFLLSVVWAKKNYRYHALFSASFFIIFALLVLYSGSVSTTLLITSIAVVLATIPGIITLIIIWRLKRLPELHSLLAACAIIIIVFGQILENILSISGYLWLSESVDLLGWIILYLSTVIKPNYT